MHFEFALGNYDSSIYCSGDNSPPPPPPDTLDAEIHRMLAGDPEEKEEGLEVICLIGRLFMFVFNSANAVLLLNLIIAILSSTYAFFEDKKIGLYYEVLVSRFSVMEFDERFGSCACA